MFYKKIKNKEKGSMIVEIIVATSIIVVFFLVALNVAQKTVTLSRRAVHSAQAAFLLEEGAESVKIFRDNNTWANFTSFFNPASTYCLPGTVSSWTSALSTSSPCSKIGVFTRIVNVANVNRDGTSGDIVSSGGMLDSGTKLFTITVSWPETGNTITRTLKFYVSDIHS
jgi:Tfp pilus assembly protein PilV